jgi:signal transduction histidine kinase
MPRSIARRIVLTTLAVGLFGAIAALVVAWRVAGEALGAQIAPLVIERFDDAAARSCAAAPAAWSMALWPAVAMRGYAYDARTGRAANPAAPPLRADLVEHLERGPEAFAVDMRSADGRRALAFRTAAAAPCDLIQVTWHNPLAMQRAGRIIGVSTIAAALFATALGLFAIVWPLIRRIRRLGAAATRVGEATGYQRIEPPGDAGDELDALGRVLDRAHLRIRDDARLLEDQREALERHLARIAHDLRTPLTSLQIALEFAADRVDQPAVRDSLTGALRDAVYLSGLTYNLRLASKLRSGWDPSHDVADVDLVDLVTRIVDRARLLARRRQIELELSIPDDAVRVRCNAVAVEQAVTNVVENAVAYGDPDGHVAVVLATAADGFALEVSDDGPGVPPASLPRLGQATFRSDEARQRDPRGNGLGLAITAEVCERIGWTLAFAALEPRGLQVAIRGARAA